MVHRPHHDVVRQNVQFLDFFTLDVGSTGLTQDTCQSRPVDFPGNDLGRKRDLRQQFRKISPRLGISPLLIQKMSFQ